MVLYVAKGACIYDEVNHMIREVACPELPRLAQCNHIMVIRGREVIGES